jgi:hypothetical protein
MTKLLDLVIPLYSFSNLAFKYAMFGTITTPTLIGMIMSIIYFLLPVIYYSCLIINILSFNLLKFVT